MSMKVTPARPLWTSLTAAWTVTVCPTCALTSAGAIVCARTGSAATIKPRAKMSVRIAVPPCHNAIDSKEHNMNIHSRQLRPVGWIEQPADSRGGPVITLYSYPTLFGVADNNGYGLKVFAFLHLAGVPFRHEHIFDASQAPRGQLPYVGDSETILTFVIQKYRLTIDAALTPAQRTTNLLITRMLDDLYWVMSYSRWKDERYWPAFRDALLREHPGLTEEGLTKAQAFNLQRYHYQGIGRYD